MTREEYDIVRQRRESRRWWLKLFLQPALVLGAAAIAIAGLGAAQRLGWVSAGGGGGAQVVTGETATRYICPMMCTPPQSEPGRCPVCAMELVAATSGSEETDATSIQIEPASRRVANIRTVAVESLPLSRRIRTVGELAYDEGALATISAYVDGRLDRLYADYTGVVVTQGDHLALLYSPELYAVQVELIETRRAMAQSATSTFTRVVEGQQRLYEGARQKLAELGMTAGQINQLEQSGKANSRIQVCSPIRGTVIEKLAVEGQYVKTGQPIYRIADLSSVWLVLELFPEDAATIRYGQKVTAEVQSLPGRQFSGRVAFVDPIVNPKTRTVGVRVVIGNEQGSLRIGDYATAHVEVPLNSDDTTPARIYDPQLAGKWISPRHPHVVEDAPGACRICGVDLVPAAALGFTDEPIASHHSLALPRDAVLMAGRNSVVYVETEPGRFELRSVTLGPSIGNRIVILRGIAAGEQVAVSGNFLIDSQMQLAGKPSLIDPTRATQRSPGEIDGMFTAEQLAALSTLSEEDRAQAKAQKICPVTELPLGSMGPPLIVDVRDQQVFICCKGCEAAVQADPEKYLARLAAQRAADDSRQDLPQMDLPQMGLPEIALPQMVAPPATLGGTIPTANDEAKKFAQVLARMSPPDRTLAEQQKTCPVADMPLGSMGIPIKVDVKGKPVFICCEGCRESLLAEPAKYLAKLSREVAR